MIGERNSVVVHFKDGSLLKGFTHDFVAERPLFHLHVEHGAETGTIKEVKVANLKAVFFVKSYEGDKDYKEKRTFEEVDAKNLHGIKIRVDFKDGEIIRGLSLGYNKSKKGFFIVPIDPFSNNIRIYVVSDAAARVVVGPATEQ
jgi:hypothetical protein